MGLGRRVACGLLVFTLAGCAAAPDDPEQRLRDAIAAGEQAVEAGSVKQAAALIATDYRDDRGLDKRALVQLLLGYLHRHRDIHLLTRIVDLRLDAAGTSAQVQLLVAMAGVPIASFDALPGLRADLYRFELTFSDTDDGWRLSRADWRRARLDELLD